MILPEILGQAAPAAPLVYNHWQELWFIGKGLAFGLPLLWAALQLIKNLRSERTSVSDSALRDSSVIKGIVSSTEKEIATLSLKINSNKDEINERLKEANTYRENLKVETIKVNDSHSKIIEEIRGLVYNMRTDIEILKSENTHQNKDLASLSAENKLIINKVEAMVKDIGILVNGPSV